MKKINRKRVADFKRVADLMAVELRNITDEPIYGQV
jgi:hypothetical protein